MDISLPSYNSPPVIEVIYGVAFSPLESMKAPYTGLFWSLIKDEFPKVQHAAPVGSLPQEFDLGNLPLPRIWFISDDDNYIVQLQNNRFIFNWRSIRQGDIYPRFDTVQAGFMKYFAKFQEFVDCNSLGDLIVHNYELTYINHIERVQKYRKLQNIGSLFPDLRWRTPKNRFLPPPSYLTWNLGFDFGDQGSMTVDLKPAQRRSDKSDLYVLELKALGRADGSDGSDASRWFEQAREWIVRGFADLTSNSAQTNLWGRQNGS